MNEPIKVKFPLPDDREGIEAEWMWAGPLHGQALALDNSPFHVYGISFKDAFEVELAGNVLQFVRVVSKSGHRTVRVRFPRSTGHAAFLAIWPRLEALGCSYEGSQLEMPLYSIDVPPGADLDAVVDFLAEQEQESVLEYEEADCHGWIRRR